MLKIHQLYLKKFLFLFIILFLIVGSIVYYWLKEFYIEQTKISLLHNIELISHHLEEKKSLDSVAKKIKEKLNLRLTIIDINGDVIAESHEDKTTMDNHKYRDEVMEANKSDYGFIIRYSDTVHLYQLYVAKQYRSSDNTIYYIRMARALDTISGNILNLGIKVGVIVLLFFLFILYAAYKISSSIESETNKIMKFLYKLTKEKRDSYIKSEFSVEFFNITKYLTKVAKILTKQDKQKAKYTAKLKNSNEQKDNIISAISHEFKNPIAVINGYSQTLLEDQNINEDIQKKFLTKIYKNGHRLSGLIDTLRLSIKLDEKQRPLQESKVNLYELTHDAIDTLRVNYKNREILPRGEENITIKADEALLNIAISNLIENSLKYSEDEVEVDFTEKYISIKDSGIGISKSDISKVTNKFYRVSSNGWNNSLGLGLSIVSNIIDIHHFTLEIKSVVNEGSEFIIHF